MDYQQYDAYVRAVRAERHVAARTLRPVRRDRSREHVFRRAVAEGLVQLAGRVADRPQDQVSHRGLPTAH